MSLPESTKLVPICKQEEMILKFPNVKVQPLTLVESTSVGEI